jgi:hypothetical protein
VQNVLNINKRRKRDRNDTSGALKVVEKTVLAQDYCTSSFER